ncbi:death on curing protein [Halorhodospira halochloris]|uniref:Death on curing protein n=1 Tax=Halorhodospira halochloris TaxID=1052 RepID=A0A0X8XAK6_HALHR|nr:type II toxin-antitoxin system RelE/ParE family toxin [Halorhodospira halochloris]MBK1652643.1 addiction module toxin RelE [Halorhodospira halochloris]MCG5548826.1 type II toxin-antitoxin system RelE/ParE family toxin [Halorhodospira halochloris]BAU57903.1 death on curing protein [Halorhodospira halochloris]
MAKVVYSPNALDNLERAMLFLLEQDQGAADRAVTAITTAVDMLSHHPLLGRQVAGEIRELVISYGKTGYVALYRYVPAWSEVRILAIRHQRELHYPR